MRVLFTLAFFLILSIYAISFYSRPSKKVRIASEIRLKTAKKLKNEMNLIPFGFGGQMMNQIKMLGLDFQYPYYTDIEKGRHILLKAVEIFLKEINSHEKIRPYLDNYPFEPKNVEISIFLKKKDGSNVDKGELSLISINRGTLHFNFKDSDSSTSKEHKETYQEALEIVQHQEKQEQTFY